MSMQDVLEQIRSLLKKKRGRISAISRELPKSKEEAASGKEAEGKRTQKVKSKSRQTQS